MRVATWNTQWLTAGSRRRAAAVDEIASWGADVVALTEVDLSALDGVGGHMATGGDDWGYLRRGERFKVMLMSRAPWREVDPVGEARLPPGRFVAGTTRTPIGDVRVVGVCIPWRDAHVRTGRRDRAPWEDHLRFVRVLRRVLAEQVAPRLVVAGDFNQAFDARPPARVREALAEALADVDVVTHGASCGRRLLDHVAVRPGLVAEDVQVRCLAHTQPALSDHDAALARLATPAPE